MADEGRFGWPTLVVAALVAVGSAVGLAVVAPGDEADNPPRKPPATSPSGMSTLVFGVWGSEAEIDAYQEVVDNWNAESEVVDVRLEEYDGPGALAAAVNSGADTADAPDLYLLRHEELPATVEAGSNRPLQDLLDARGINISDDYYRESVTAFSTADGLECMPYTSSPMVVYYNTELVDFERMAARELPAPGPDDDEWDLEEFAAAAEFASRPRRGTAGVVLAPTVEALAPFVYSDTGHLFDDEETPTALDLADASEAIADTLAIVRDPRLTLNDEQLEQRSAVEWFTSGRLGMITGYRDLVPELRAAKGLSFDVMPMPKVGGGATVGELTGVCLAAGDPERVAQSADFLVHLVSNAAVAQVVSATGSVVPSNQSVAFDDAFLQPDQEPAHAMFFNNSVRDIESLPFGVDWDVLDQAIGPAVRDLFTQPVLGDVDDVEERLRGIDEQSRAVLDPEFQDVEESDDLEPPEGAQG